MRPAALDIVLLLIALCVGLPIALGSGGGADLLALWLAATDVAGSAQPTLYPPTTGVFSLQPPDGWTDRAAALRHDGWVYPYIYPPLWAWLIAPLTRITDFADFNIAMRIVNVACMVATPFLIWRMTRPRMSALRFVLIAQIVLWGTLFGALAVYEGQPHIAMTFLVALALERLHAGAPRSAGAALAVAAALKLSPALLILPILVLPGGLAAAASFALAGGALALTSVLLAGWPAHALFLDHVSAISRTAVGNMSSVGLDRLLSRYVFDTPMIRSAAAATGDVDAFSFGLFVKTAPQIWIERTLLPATLIAATWAMARLPAPDRARHAWPALLFALALLTPLGWLYYFILPLCFAPLLIERHPRLGGVLLLVLCLPYTAQTGAIVARLGLDPLTAPWLATLALCAIALAFAAGPVVARRSPMQPVGAEPVR